MNRTLASVVAALALGLGGCATDPGMGGMVYRDGGYYAPARDGYGDYYVAQDVADDWYDDPFYDAYYDPFVFGPSWYGGGGGYCSVRYRYCPAGWYGAGSPFAFGFGTGLWIGFGGRSYYDPWGGYYSPWAYGSERHHDWHPPHRRPHPSQPSEGSAPSPWRPPGDTVGRIDDGDAGLPGEGGPDGRFLDTDRDGKPDARLVRRRLMRPQPLGTPQFFGQPDASQAPTRPEQGGARFGGERSGGGDSRGNSGGGARPERSESSSQTRGSADGGDRAPRGRRREREG